MAAKAHGTRGSRIVADILRARFLQQKSTRRLTYQKAAALADMNSPQHFHRILHGHIPLQLDHLKGVSKALDISETSLLLLWNVGRLLDAHVPAHCLDLLCFGRDVDGGAIPGVAGGGDVPTARSGNGSLPGADAAKAADGRVYDVELLVRLLKHGAAIAPASDGETNVKKLSTMIVKVVGLVLVAVQPAWIYLKSLLLIMCTASNSRSNNITQFVPA